MSVNHKNKNRLNKYPNFKLSLLASAVMSIAVSGVLHAAESPETDKKAADNTEVIEVKGTRASVLSAMNMKRGGETVMDAISAKDIGSLPDRSVLEAVVRLPGVSIERFAGANDPDHYGVEGSGVVVRGLTHTRSEFNGRDTFTANSGRGLSFQDVPPELMGGVELYKNQSADMIEGGIAGTVNLITRKPFDSDKRVLAFTLDGTYSDLVEEVTPTYSGLFSDVFETDLGRFGLLLNYSSSELKAQSDGTQIGRYEEQKKLENPDEFRTIDGQTIMVPRTVRLTRKNDDREREGFATSLQWESPDKTLLTTAEYIRSDSSLSWYENAIEMGDDGVNQLLYPVPGTEFEFDEHGRFQSGLITSRSWWRGNDFPDRQPGGGVEFGAQHSMVSRNRAEGNLVEDFGLNVKYRPNDSWAFNVDFQYVDATSEILDYSVMGAIRTVVELERKGSELPKITLHDPAYSTDEGRDASEDAAHFTDPHNTFWRSAMDHISDNEGKEYALAADAKYTFDDGFITSIKVGARTSTRDQTTRQTTYNWGWLSEAWANGSVWFGAKEGEPGYQEGEPGAGLSDQYEKVDFSDFARGGVLFTEGETAFLFPKRSLVHDYANAEETFSELNPGWKALENRTDEDGNVIPKMNRHFLPKEVNATKEMNTAFYVKVNFDGELGNMDYSGNFGARYVNIENDTEGFISFPDSVGDPTKPNDPDNHIPQDQKDFGDNGETPQDVSSSFSKLLPSFNLKLNLTDDMLLRFGFSKAIALPDLGLMRSYVDIQGVDQVIEHADNGQDVTGAYYPRYTGTSGNPNLKPMESNNYDLAYEWYFAEGVGSLSLSLFYKQLSNYFINGSIDQEYTNNGVTQTVQVMRASNGDKGSVKGAELAYQQFFDFLPGALSGLGVQFNYTYIKEEGSPNSGLEADKSNPTEGGDFAFDNLPLEGLSKDNVNLVAMYEKYGLNVRFAYNWRSEYLLTTRDVITQLPIYNEANGQLDASVFYDLNKNLKLGLQGTNLTDSITRTSMQIDNEGNQTERSWFGSDRRVSLVLKGNF